MYKHGIGPMRIVALAALCPVAIFAAGVRADEPAGAVTIAENVRLERVHFDQNLLPDRDHAGFGALLYDQKGELALHDDQKTWLYTTGLSERPPGDQRDWYGKWISYVREFDVKTLVSGPSKVVLGLAGSDRWAVIHDVIEIDPGLFVAFYSANGTVRAAVSDKPDGIFTTVQNFKIAVTDAWEREGGKETSLESNGAHVLIDESDRAVTLWVGYDSYHVDKTAGQLGWAKVRIDKRLRDVEFIGKYARNPLQMLPKNYIAARCGGNLATNIRFGNQYVFFYYSRPDKERIMLTVALGADPLFRHITRTVEFEPPLGDEQVIEKFEAYVLEDELYVIYENKLEANHWGTGIRVYKIEQ